MARKHFSKEDKTSIVRAIEEAEKNTSGELVVHIENRCKGDVLDRAAGLFEQLKMHKTEARNGVLFYLAIRDRKFAILGDAGINAKVTENFWDTIKTQMAVNFEQGRFTQGLCEGIHSAGQQLKSHFPHRSDDVNELPDQISFGE